MPDMRWKMPTWSGRALPRSRRRGGEGAYQKLGASARGHSVTMLLSGLPSSVPVNQALIDKAKELDKHYPVTLSHCVSQWRALRVLHSGGSEAGN